MGKSSAKIEILELYSTQGVHSSFLTALAKNLSGRTFSITADMKALQWPEIDVPKKHPLSVPQAAVCRDLFLGALGLWRLLLARHFVLISGAGPLVHLILALFAPLRGVAIVVHSEFARLSRGKSIGDRIIGYAFTLYRIRRACLVVLSDSARKEILRRGLYSADNLLILTHPLLTCCETPKPATIVKTAALIGLLRRQKLRRVRELLPRIKNEHDIKVAAFGKTVDITFEELACLFDEVSVSKERYSEDERKSFFCEHDVGALLFFGGEEYALTTSGVICDATRLGCFVLGPLEFDQGHELIGELYNPHQRCLISPTHSEIQTLVLARADQNLAQLEIILRHLV